MGVICRLCSIRTGLIMHARPSRDCGRLCAPVVGQLSIRTGLIMHARPSRDCGRLCAPVVGQLSIRTGLIMHARPSRDCARLCAPVVGQLKDAGIILRAIAKEGQAVLLVRPVSLSQQSAAQALCVVLDAGIYVGDPQVDLHWH